MPVHYYGLFLLNTLDGITYVIDRTRVSPIRSALADDLHASVTSLLKATRSYLLHLFMRLSSTILLNCCCKDIVLLPKSLQFSQNTNPTC
jgi:hypothetical protein